MVTPSFIRNEIVMLVALCLLLVGCGGGEPTAAEVSATEQALEAIIEDAVEDALETVEPDVIIIEDDDPDVVVVEVEPLEGDTVAAPIDLVMAAKRSEAIPVLGERYYTFNLAPAQVATVNIVNQPGSGTLFYTIAGGDYLITGPDDGLIADTVGSHDLIMNGSSGATIDIVVSSPDEDAVYEVWFDAFVQDDAATEFDAADSLDTATTLTFGDQYNGLLGGNDVVDYFAVDVPAEEIILVELSNSEIGRELLYLRLWVNETESIETPAIVPGESGALVLGSEVAALYTIEIHADATNELTNYSFSVDTFDQNDAESGGDVSGILLEAWQVASGEVYGGVVTENGSDCYRFAVREDDNVDIQLSTPDHPFGRSGIIYTLNSADGEVLLQGDIVYGASDGVAYSAATDADHYLCLFNDERLGLAVYNFSVNVSAP